MEYNQLDPLLKSQGTGDIPDPATGFSPYPGNANNLVIELDSYIKTLQGEDQGVVTEFVNPKYKDPQTRTSFIKPTRLECMMQDFPKLLQKEIGGKAKVGFTLFERWLTFSPAKNSLSSGQASVKKGSIAPGTLSSAESDLYSVNARKLRISCPSAALDHTASVSLSGIPVTAGPRIIVKPSVAMTRNDWDELLAESSSISISPRSTIVVDGNVKEIKNLSVDGSLIVRVNHPDASVSIDGVVVQNEGWEFVEIDPNNEALPEHIRIRGYDIVRHETQEFVIDEAGEFVIDANEVRRL